MAEQNPLSAEIRERAGKGAARATRRAGRVPAVIYGNKVDPMMISIDPLVLFQELNKPGFFGRVFDITLGKDVHRVLPRDVQFDPVTDRPLHVDFLRFSADTKINIDVTVIFQNEEESPGLKRGGVLNIVRRDLDLICSPDNIPETIIVDLTGLEIGDSIHISHIELPDGVESAITDRDFTIATIAAPSIVKAEAAEAAEGEEGEEGEVVEGEEGAAEDAEEASEE
jgi:large subunit ribosomal protein L25